MMFKISIVVFRECLEIAVLIAIIMAATKPVKHSRIYILLGVICGFIASIIFAYSAQLIANSFDGLGSEVFDACVMLFTSFVIGWTVIWMQGYSIQLKRNLTTLSNNIQTGHSNQFVLILIVALSILREGAEIILFLYSISSAEHISTTQYVAGIVFGAISGLALGTILYLGMIKYIERYIFKISTILLILIAAGLASDAAGIFTSSGMIEIYTEQLWDSSWLVDNNSIIGKILHIVIGYDARPNGIQILFYLATIMFVTAIVKIKSKMSHKQYA